MIRIRFTNETSKRRALGYLAGRFSFKSWATDAFRRWVSERCVSFGGEGLGETVIGGSA